MSHLGLVHVLTGFVAVVIAVTILARRKGDRSHRRLGRTLQSLHSFGSGGGFRLLATADHDNGQRDRRANAAIRIIAGQTPVKSRRELNDAVVVAGIACNGQR